MDHAEYCAELEVEVARFAAALDAADPANPVPTCPAWTVGDLASHLGTVHRWAEHLVRVRAAERTSARDMGISRGPATAAWIRDGGDELVATLRAADPDDPMWAWGADQHVRFWSRRQLHETLVHRFDLELASGREPVADAPVAVDAIDELLVNLESSARFSPRVAALVGRGERIGFRETDRGTRWVATLGPAGFAIGHDPDPVDASLESDALALLLVVARRRPLDLSPVSVVGDESLIHYWIDHSAVE